MRRSTVSLCHCHILFAFLLIDFLPSFLILLLSLCHTMRSGVTVKTLAVVALGSMATGFIQELRKIDANACALNILLCPSQDKESFSFFILLWLTFLLVVLFEFAGKF